MSFAFTGARVFDGESICGGLAVVIDGARIIDVVAVENLASGIERCALNGRSEERRVGKECRL